MKMLMVSTPTGRSLRKLYNDSDKEVKVILSWCVGKGEHYYVEGKINHCFTREREDEVRSKF